MAERLTRKIGYEYEKAKRETQLLEINNKLGKLEDILEKYGLDVEELEKEIHSLMLIISILSDYGIEDYNELDEILKEFSYMKKMETEIGKELKFYKTDRGTWKRACELACENMKLPVDILIGNKEFNECHSIVEYFYQQVKKDGEEK